MHNDDVTSANSATTGQLLVACPPLDDPNFDRTVVLMLEHNDVGALGVVLNRPRPEGEIEGLEAWWDRLAPPAVVFSGGPVETDALIALAHTDGGWESLDLAGPPPDGVRDVRIFRGYSGWSPGQLEYEIDEGAWMVFDAVPGDLVSVRPHELWRVVLRRQGGRLAWIADAPDHLSLN